MGAIAAVLHKGKQRAANVVFIMLKELAHRGKDACGIASAKERSTADSLEELKQENVLSNIVLGYVFSKILPEDTPQLITTDNFTLVFEGRIYPPSRIMEKPELNAEKIAETIIKNCNGAYTLAMATSNSLIVGRDTIGAVPLYFGSNQTLCAFASERKALWKLGLKAESFPPGNIAVIKKNTSLSFKAVQTVRRPPPKPLTINSAAARLQRLLLQSTKDRVSMLKEVAVAFSGGLDSSIVAFLARECGVKVQLVTVGLENTPETRYAEVAAEALAMPICVKTYTTDDVEKALHRVLWLIEEADAVQASIALPLYWTAELASAQGLGVLLAGQGADELFGGYHKYLKVLVEKDTRALEKTLFDDAVRCYETNFQRDNQTCAFHNVELRLPFADLRVVTFALSLPLHLKIESSTDRLRKRVLREAAENCGLPRSIAHRPKKAVQYATGVDKALRKLARREGLNPSDYVRRIFQEVFLM